MGSDSDLEVMSEAGKILEDFKVSYEISVVSAHRTPDLLYKHGTEAKKKGEFSFKIVLAVSRNFAGVRRRHQITCEVVEVSIAKALAIIRWHERSVDVFDFL